MIRLLIIFVSLIGSIVQSETIEERLPVCIEQAEELLLKGTRIKEALATDSDSKNVNNILEVMFAGEIIEMFNELIERHLEEDATASELQNNLEKVANPMSNRFNYIADMLVEHWSDKGNSAKARYIAGCANNFDGKTETQADQIAGLADQIASLKEENSNLLNKSELQKNRIVSLEDKVSSQFKNEARLSVEVIALKRELTELSKKNEQLEVNAQLYKVYKEKFSKLLSKSSGAAFVEELLSMSAFDRNVALRDSKIGSPDVQRAGLLGGCIRRLRDQAQASVDCKAVIAEFLESEAN